MMPNRNALLCHYHYDPLDRLIDCAPFAQATTRRFYLNGRLATETQGTEQRSIMQHDDQLLAQQQRQGDTVEARLLATDRQRSVLSTLANPPCLLAYAPYGHRPLGNGLLSLLGFNGERSDPVTGHYLLGNGYRAFNPVLMRFNGPDSWSPFGEGGLNAYAYCLDPVNFADPTGHVVSSALSNMFNSISKIFTSSARNKPTPSAPTIHIQKTGKMKNISRLGHEVFSFEDKYKGEPRLNILAHGARKSGSALIASGKTRITPEQLHSMILDQGTDLTSFDNIRTLVCYSGEGGANSFAAKFSRLTNKPVKGYIGTVATNTSSALVESKFVESAKKYPNASMNDKYDFGKIKIVKKNRHNFFSSPFRYLSHNYNSIRFSP